MYDIRFYKGDYRARQEQANADKAVAFVVPGDVGITYHINVWHHLLAVLDRAARFAVFMWRDDSPQDEEFVAVAEPFLVTVD